MSSNRIFSPWPQIAWVCAGMKFALVLVSLLYLFYGLAASLSKGVHKQECSEKNAHLLYKRHAVLLP
jgi:hypothetical protein